ncbi:hypothetical protein ISI15_16525 [Burkholderia pseudomallei]|nr:hypothetical protein [Burkholderia pseudomallei]
MQFLRALWSFFTKSPQPEVAGGDFVTANGNVARFVFEKRHLFANGTPKPKAFEPELHPELRRFETSVCGLNGVPDDRLWRLGRTVRAGKAAIAVVEISVQAIEAAQLVCEPLPQPDYDEHGVVLGWSNDPEAKDARMSAQQDLVAGISAEQVRRPPPDRVGE